MQDPNSNKRQTHFLTQGEMEELKLRQQAGEQEYSPANKNKSYVIPKEEAHLVHLELETKSFNPTTGEKTSKPFVQSFYPEEFDKMVADGNFKGMSVDVIHDPRSKAQATEAKVEAAINSGVQNSLVPMPLDEMSLEDLKIKYASLYKEDAEEGLSVSKLKQAITEKLEFLRGEGVLDNLNHASEDDGSGKGPAVNERAAAGNTATTAGNSIPPAKQPKKGEETKA